METINDAVKRRPAQVPSGPALEHIMDEAYRLGGGIVRRYLRDHGLRELPVPAFINADMAEMWTKTPKGWERIVYTASPSGIVRALEKGFLLAPPPENTDVSTVGVDAAVESQAARAEMAPQVESVSKKDRGPRSETILRCPICKMEFAYQKLLDKHVARHENQADA